MKITRKMFTIGMVICVFIGFCSLKNTGVSATDLTANPTGVYSGTLYGYDSNGTYYIVQTSTFCFSDCPAWGIWPSGRTITYTPCTSSHQVAAPGFIARGVSTSPTIYYNSGYAYGNNYCIHAKTNATNANTTIQFFV